MEKNFSVKEFVSKYTSTAKQMRTSFFSNELKTEEYINYNKKLLLAEKIVKLSTYATEPVIKNGEVVKDENGNVQYRQTNQIRVNSCMRYVLFVYTIIQNYTNINMDNTKLLDEFDLLNKEGLIEQIFAIINEKEIQEFNKVVQMTFDDFMVNNATPQSFISNQVQRVTDVLGALLQPVVKKIESLDEKEIEKLSRHMEKMLKVM